MPSEDSPLLRDATLSPDGAGELVHASDTNAGKNPEGQTSYDPLPKAQFVMLCFLRMLDPLNFSQIFPYVNELVEGLGVAKDPSQVGYYSGLVESAFAFAQLFAIYPWAYISDRFGRRPVILSGIGGLVVTSVVFGLSRTLPMLLWSRALAGLFSGNVAVIPSVLCEITSPANEAFVFPFFGIWWPLGGIIGPLIGGTFSTPAKRFPKLFSHPFFTEYPYFFPCFVVSIVALIGFLLAYFFLEETSKGQLDKVKGSRYGATYQDESALGEEGEQGPLGLKELLSNPMINALCASACALSFQSVAFDVLFVLFCYSPIPNGGLGFSASSIGYALAISGAAGAILQMFIMPYIIKKIDLAEIYHFSMKLWPIVFLGVPLLRPLALGFPIHPDVQANQSSCLVWVGIALVLTISRVATLPYTVNTLLIKKYTPNKASLGATTGLVQFFICFARAFSPAFVCSIYAFSVEHSQVLNGYGWAAFMVCVGGISYHFSSQVVKQSKLARVRL